MTREPILLRRDCEAIEIPSGAHRLLAPGTSVRIMNSLGGSYTVVGELGGMYRIDAKNADALGITPAGPSKSQPAASSPTFSDEMVRKELKSVYDPEIPVNIVDLGLVYSCVISKATPGAHTIEIKMTMTAPGCGMGDVLKADIEKKLRALPEVREVSVEIVFDPPWHMGRMSEAARLQLGFDSDYEPGPSPFPIYKPNS